MTEPSEPPRTEEEVRQQFAATRRVILLAAAPGMLMFILVVWYIDLANWPIWVGGMLVVELACFGFVFRELATNEKKAIDELREEHGLTPISNYPDVGV